MESNEFATELKYVVPMRVRNIIQPAGSKATLVKAPGASEHIAGEPGDGDGGESAGCPSGDEAQACVIRRARTWIAVVGARIIAATKVPAKSDIIDPGGIRQPGPPSPGN